MPSILHVDREARAIALQYYKLDFKDENHDRRFEDAPRGGWRFDARPLIYRNFKKDRLCPMGYYGYDTDIDFWGRHHRIKSCAVNMFEPKRIFDYTPRTTSIPMCSNKMSRYNNGTLKEILLYHTRWQLGRGERLGMFEFIDITEEASSPAEWKALTEARDIFLQRCRDCEYPDENLQEGEKPGIRLVALMVDGVRHW